MPSISPPRQRARLDQPSQEPRSEESRDPGGGSLQHPVTLPALRDILHNVLPTAYMQPNYAAPPPARAPPARHLHLPVPEHWGQAQYLPEKEQGQRYDAEGNLRVGEIPYPRPDKRYRVEVQRRPEFIGPFKLTSADGWSPEQRKDYSVWRYKALQNLNDKNEPPGVDSPAVKQFKENFPPLTELEKMGRGPAIPRRGNRYQEANRYGAAHDYDVTREYREIQPRPTPSSNSAFAQAPSSAFGQPGPAQRRHPGYSMTENSANAESGVGQQGYHRSGGLQLDSSAKIHARAMGKLPKFLEDHNVRDYRSWTSTANDKTYEIWRRNSRKNYTIITAYTA